LLDIGGASGSYTEAFLQAYPGMRATLFDLPSVIQMAQRRLADTDLLDRITFVAGDYHKDELPAGHDLALLSAIIHQNSPEHNIELYGKIYRALQPGGPARYSRPRYESGSYPARQWGLVRGQYACRHPRGQYLLI
jgi:trans-aconitate methyltransferase